MLTTRLGKGQTTVTWHFHNHWDLYGFPDLTQYQLPKSQRSHKALSPGPFQWSQHKATMGRGTVLGRVDQGSSAHPSQLSGGAACHSTLAQPRTSPAAIAVWLGRKVSGTEVCEAN